MKQQFCSLALLVIKLLPCLMCLPVCKEPVQLFSVPSVAPAARWMTVPGPLWTTGLTALAAADLGVLLPPYFAECNTLNGLVSEVFIRFFVETVGHYSLFLTQNEKGERAFQREAFRKSVASKSIRRFLEVFMESQMFAGFIQDRELRKCRAKGKAGFAGCSAWCTARGPSSASCPGAARPVRVTHLPKHAGRFERASTAAVLETRQRLGPDRSPPSAASHARVTAGTVLRRHGHSPSLMGGTPALLPVLAGGT